MDDNKQFRDASVWIANAELKQKIIQDITASEQNFGTVMQTLQEVNAYFLSRAETVLLDTAIKTVSESAWTPYWRYALQIADRRVHNPFEDLQ